MPISRFLFSSTKRCSGQTFYQLRRFGLSNKVSSAKYTNSSRESSRKLYVNPVTNAEIPTPRSWSTYIIPAALLGFAGIVTFVHYNDERRIVKGRESSSGSATMKGPVIGGPFTLVDTENKIVTERSFLGNWTLLYFGYTSSPDVGPEQVKLIAKATDTLDKQGIKLLPIFVTIDPERDTPSQLHAYLKEFGSRIVGLTGTVGAIRQMAQEYRVYYKKVEEEGDDYLVESSHNMYLMNQKMEIVRLFGTEYTAEELSEAISKEVSRSRI